MKGKINLETELSRIFRIVVSSILFFAFSMVLCAKPQEKQKKCMMWKLQLDGHHGYIMGVYHDGTEDMYPLDKTITDAFNESEILVMELGNDTDPAELEETLMRTGFYKNGGTVEKELSKKEIAKLKKFLSENKIPYDNVKNMKPWLLAINLPYMADLSPEKVKEGFFIELGIENVFTDRALIQGMKIVGMETQKEQLEGYYKLSLKKQKMLLFDYIDNRHNDNWTPEIDAWKNGDITKLSDIWGKSLLKQPEFKKEFFTDRDRKMAEKIIEHLKTGKTFFTVVGGGHVIGKESIIEQLKKNGVTCTQAVQTSIPPVDTGKCLLWEVSSKNKKLYLMGLIPNISSEDGIYPLNKTILNAFNESEALVLASSGSVKENPQIIGVYPPGKSLVNDLSPAGLEQVKNYFRNKGVADDQISEVLKMKPWYLAIVFAQATANSLGYTPEFDLTNKLHAMAEKRGMDIKVIMKKEPFISLVDKLPGKEQESMLLETILTPFQVERAKNSYTAEIWKTGNAKAMREWQQMQTDSPGMQKIISKHNKKIFKEIEKLISSGKKYFIPVNCLELLGENGIIKQLKTKGLKVRQLKRK